MSAATRDRPDSAAYDEHVQADIPGMPPTVGSHDFGAMLTRRQFAAR
jgi:hypothetical protein